MDPFAVKVGNGEVATVVFTVGDALGDALVRPGRVVVLLVLVGLEYVNVALTCCLSPCYAAVRRRSGTRL